MSPFKSSQNLNSKVKQSPFDSKAMEIFHEQAQDNRVYRQYLEFLDTDISAISEIRQIPFMPIEFFKTHTVTTNDWPAEKVFESSGTTGLRTSCHHVRSLVEYHTHAQEIFEGSFGPLKHKTILGLLPSYLERDNSSLVSMVDYFIRTSDNPRSGFFLNDFAGLEQLLSQPVKNEEIFLFGVTFALLDLAEQIQLDLPHVNVIETGGMKGRREEIVKEELYAVLKERLGLNKIYTEYGMTELLSQAYGQHGILKMPSTMKVLIRDINDPFNYLIDGKTGGINIIDLANQHTCSFIETKDLGRITAEGCFEILGRFDNADLRGCNLLVS